MTARPLQSAAPVGLHSAQLRSQANDNLAGPRASPCISVSWSP